MDSTLKAVRYRLGLWEFFSFSYHQRKLHKEHYQGIESRLYWTKSKPHLRITHQMSPVKLIGQTIKEITCKTTQSFWKHHLESLWGIISDISQQTESLWFGFLQDSSDIWHASLIWRKKKQLCSPEISFQQRRQTLNKNRGLCLYQRTICLKSTNSSCLNCHK